MTPEEQERLFELREELKKCESGCAVAIMGMPKLEELLQLILKEAA